MTGKNGRKCTPTQGRSSPQPISVETVARNLIEEHPGNPRKMNDVSRRHLEDGLDKYGLLEPIVVNRSTGHVLSGHQRLKWMDRKARSKDYPIQVAYVEIGEDEEMNVLALLNNDSAMGEWDADLLRLALLDGKIDASTAGFSETQLESLFPMDSEISSLFDVAPDPVMRTAEEMDKIRQGRAGKGLNQDGMDTDNFLVLVFPSAQKRRDFLGSYGVDWRERYFSPETFGMGVSSGSIGKPRSQGKTGSGSNRLRGAHGKVTKSGIVVKERHRRRKQT